MRPVTETSTLLADGLFGRLTNGRENFRSVLTVLTVYGERNELQAVKPRALQVKQETGSYLEALFVSILLSLEVVYFCVNTDRILRRNEYHFKNGYFEPF